MTPPRPVSQILRAVSLIEGADMPVRRGFAAHGGVFLDPFLMLDHFGPAAIGPHSKGFPPHPHKGFETVTYMISGAIEHHDSFGGHAIIGPGDVQWMTAGSGIVHSETPPAELRQKGGAAEGLQVWINLPQGKKSLSPGYEMVRAAELPRYRGRTGDVEGLVIAGALPDAVGAVAPKSPLTLAVLTMAQGARFTLPLPSDWQAGIYVAHGALTAGDRTAEAGHTLVFGKGDGDLAVAATKPSTILLMAGRPLDEPVVASGPFVMTTEGEVRQARLDYEAGKFGRLT